MDSTLIYSTLFEVFLDGEFVGAKFLDGDGRRRPTVAALVFQGAEKVAPRGKALFVTVAWESSEGWSPLSTDYEKTRVVRDTNYRIDFFTRDLGKHMPSTCALFWDPVGGERKSIELYSKDRDHTVLLLGARRSGKTTFLDDLLSYLRFDDFDAFLRATDLEVPPPARPSTLECDISTLAFEGELFSFVDSPGILDYRCVENDRDNVDTVLRALRGLPHISAICFVFNPFEEISEDVLRHQILFLLSHLPKQVVRNAFFLVSKSGSRRTTLLLASLKRILGEVSERFGVDVPLGPPNVFLFENVASLAWHLEQKGVLERKVREDYGRSWTASRESLLRLLRTVRLLEPLQPYAFEFVRQNRRKTVTLGRKLLILGSKIEGYSRESRSSQKASDKISRLRTRERALEEKYKEAIHYLSGHAIVPRTDSTAYAAYLKERNTLCKHLTRFEEEGLLEERLWEEAEEDTGVFDISFYVSRRSESSTSVEQLRSMEILASSMETVR